MSGTAEVLPTPLSGVVRSAAPGKGSCSGDGCPARLRIEISNTTDRDAYVQMCTAQERHLDLYVTGPPAGAFVASGRSVTVGSSYLVPISKAEISALKGAHLDCSGLDWHGDPPV